MNNQIKKEVALEGDKYVNPTPGRFPLMGIGMLPDYTYFNSLYALDLSGCRINIAESMINFNNFSKTNGEIDPERESYINYNKSLVNCADAEIDLMVRAEIKIEDYQSINPYAIPADQQATNPTYKSIESFKKLISHLLSKKYSNISGWMFPDEPSQSAFWVIKKWQEEVETLDKKHLFYVNLLPVGAELHQCQGAFSQMTQSEIDALNLPNYTPLINSTSLSNIYRQYLDEYIKVVRPTLLSSDAYAFCHIMFKWYRRSGMQMTVYEEKAFSYNPHFFENLAIFKESRHSFWTYIQSTVESHYTHIANSDEWQFSSAMPIPTLGRIRFAAFAAIAYGAKGIAYWNMCDRKDFFQNNTKYTFTDSPFNAQGQPTEVSDYVAEVNIAIQKYAKIFLAENPDGSQDSSVNMTIDTYLTNYPFKAPLVYDRESLPSTAQKYSAADMPTVKILKGSIGFLKNIYVTQLKGFVVSYIKKTNYRTRTVEEYMVFVNMDSENSQGLDVEFTKPCHDAMLANIPDVFDEDYESFDLSAAINSVPTSTNFVWGIAPGDWRIFKL